MRKLLENNLKMGHNYCPIMNNAYLGEIIHLAYGKDGDGYGVKNVAIC